MGCGIPGGKCQRSLSFTPMTKLLPPDIDAGNARGAVAHNGPLRGGVPVKLADASCRQTHIHSGQSFGDWEFMHGDFAGPAAAVQALVAEGKGIVGRTTRQ